MTTAVRPATGRRRLRLSRGELMGFLLVGLVSMIAVTLVIAYFNSSRTVAATFTTMRIFPGERTTPAFTVSDSSSGSAANGSSPTAYAGDGRATTTAAWSTSFAGDRYVELDFNSPIATVTPASGMAFALDLASSGASDTTCFYVEVRRVSSGAVLATHGSPGSPLGCVTGTSFATVSTATPSISSGDLANDARIRIYARNSGAGGMQIDRAVLTGTAGYAAVTLYPVRLTDAADTTADTTGWSLNGP